MGLLQEEGPPIRIGGILPPLVEMWLYGIGRKWRMNQEQIEVKNERSNTMSF
jgi:hypothetical protein